MLRIARLSRYAAIKRFASTVKAPTPATLPNQAVVKMSLVGKLVLGGMVGAMGAGVYSLGAPITNDDKPMLASKRDKNATELGWSNNAYTRVMGMYKYFVDPNTSELLPDAYPRDHPMYRPLTLVIELDKLLVFSSWDKEKGWRVAKRPWADYFLSYLHNYYEIVLFTTQSPNYAAPIVDKLDAQMGAILYRIYRDGTRYDIDSGQNVKDLSILNRPLEQVVLLDPTPEHFSATQPDNAILAKPWEGDADDTYLLDMIPFLETLAVSGVSDVRQVLKSYAGKDVPTVFADNMKHVQESQLVEYRRLHGPKNAAEAQARESVASAGWSAWLGDAVLTFFGMKRTGTAPPPPMSAQELAQAQAKQHMQMMEELDKIRAMAEADSKRQQDEHKAFMKKASNLRVTLWEMWQKGPDQAVMDRADPELSAYLQQQAAAAGMTPNNEQA